MKLSLRARITAWYFTVLVVAFASFAWISDLGFRHSIETTVNDASRANLESVQSILVRVAPQVMKDVNENFTKLGPFCTAPALPHVPDPHRRLLLQPTPFN